MCNCKGSDGCTTIKYKYKKSFMQEHSDAQANQFNPTVNGCFTNSYTTNKFYQFKIRYMSLEMQRKCLTEFILQPELVLRDWCEAKNLKYNYE